MDLSIIIINHNTKSLTRQTIASAVQTIKDCSYEFIVVDNSDNINEKFIKTNPTEKVVNCENKGFSAGCNEGAKKACGEYLLFLNSDTILKENTVDMSLKFIKLNDDIGAVGVKQVKEDGTLDHGCKRGFPTPKASLYYFLGLDKKYPNSKKYGAYRQTFIDEDTISDVDSVSGAYILIKKTTFERISGFDEDYFMYGEDVDLCFKIKLIGLRVVYFGKVSFVHLKGKSGIDNPVVLKNFYKSMRIFYDKHYKNKYSRLTTMLVYLGINAKYKIAKRQLLKKR